MPRHKEAHLIDRIGWLRASVLGANDGIVSVSSLIVGEAAADPSRAAILIAGIAFRLTNLGFGLLGHALALQAGRPFAALLREARLIRAHLPTYNSRGARPLVGRYTGSYIRKPGLWRPSCTSAMGAVMVGWPLSMARSMASRRSASLPTSRPRAAWLSCSGST